MDLSQIPQEDYRPTFKNPVTKFRMWEIAAGLQANAIGYLSMAAGWRREPHALPDHWVLWEAGTEMEWGVKVRGEVKVMKQKGRLGWWGSYQSTMHTLQKSVLDQQGDVWQRLAITLLWAEMARALYHQLVQSLPGCHSEGSQSLVTISFSDCFIAAIWSQLQLGIGVSPESPELHSYAILPCPHCVTTILPHPAD